MKKVVKEKFLDWNLNVNAHVYLYLYNMFSLFLEVWGQPT